MAEVTELTVDKVHALMTTEMDEADQRVKAQIGALGENSGDPAKLAELQYALNSWSVIINAQSTVIKMFADLMKSILQKV